jgi:hypothetical protein
MRIPTREELQRIFEEKNERKQRAAIAAIPVGFTIFQIHFRGRTAHWDLRRKMEELVAHGVTLTAQKRGVIKQDVDTLQDAERWLKDIPAWSKLHPDMSPLTKIFTLGKAERMWGRLPAIWLTIHNQVFPPGSIGATRFEEGVFVIPEGWLGMSYFGCTKPYYFELFLDMPAWKHEKLVFRLLPRRPKWAATFPKEVTVWFTFRAKVEVPYIISKRNVREKKWIPEEDAHSALPPWWEEEIKPEERWWGKKLPRKEKLRRITAAHERLRKERRLAEEEELVLLQEEEFQRTSKLYQIGFEQKGRFILRSHRWRGRGKVIRGAWVEHWDLVLDLGRDYLLEWNLRENPIVEAETTGLRKKCKEQTPDGKPFREWMKWEGSIPPKNLKVFEVKVLREEKVTDEKELFRGFWKYEVQKDGKRILSKPTFARFKIGQTAWLDTMGQLHSGFRPIGNPNLSIPAYIDIIDSGRVNMVAETENFLSFQFFGKKLKGFWVMTRAAPEQEIWVFKKGKAPGLKLEGLSIA